MDKLQITDDLTLSKIILGCCNFGTSVTKEDAFNLMDFYMENGGDTFDTARAYCGWIKGGEFASEQTLGDWIYSRNCRKNIKIITKGGHPSFDGSEPSKRLSYDCINYDMEISLKLLKTDYADLYFLHRDDEDRSVQEIVDTLDELVLDGRTKAVGVSNWKLSRILEANKYAAETGKTKICSSQIQWSYAYCTPETFNDSSLICMDKDSYKEYLTAKIPVLAYTSQAGGVFSMGYKRDLIDIQDKHKKYYCKENVERYNRLLDLCEKTGVSPTNGVISYIIDNKLPACAIVGCSHIDQLKESMLLNGNGFSKEQIENF